MKVQIVQMPTMYSRLELEAESDYEEQMLEALKEAFKEIGGKITIDCANVTCRIRIIPDGPAFRIIHGAISKR